MLPERADSGWRPGVEKHAGFLINRGGATFADMTELIRQVQQRVLVETGVTLEPEVKIVK